MRNIPFIKLEKNESIYSIISRAHHILGGTNPCQTLTSITGIRGYKPMSGLPTHLSTVLNNLEINKSIYETVHNHTHYPLYKYFLKKQSRQAVLNAMYHSGAVKSRIGLLRNHISCNDSIKYCEACAKEDYHQYGFAYWHREHSASWVYFCPYHQLLLKTFDCEVEIYRGRALLLPPLGSFPRIPSTASVSAKLQSITEETQYLFDKNATVDISINEEHYRCLLGETGICSRTGRINQREVLVVVSSWLRDLKNLPGFDALFRSLDVERSWAAVLCSSSKCFHHPLKHIILLKSMGLSLADLFQTDSIPSQQPLVLLNKVRLMPTDDEIKLAIRECGSIRKAASKLKVDVTTLCCEANRLNIPYKHRTKSITKKVIQSVIVATKEGQSSSTIATNVGISVVSVNRIKRTIFTDS